MLFTPRTQIGVVARTLVGIVFCIALATTLDVATSAAVYAGRTGFWAPLVRNTVISFILAGPLFYFSLAKYRELAIARAQLQILASTDSLTSVLNRGAFAAHVEAYLNVRHGIAALPKAALLVVDADFFKKINDNYGHQIGDDALVRIAEAIRCCICDGDAVGRLGGEEFGVFLPSAEPGTAMMIAERIRQHIERIPIIAEKPSECLSVSIGGAVSLGGGTFEELFSAADHQLYDAKKSGRNRVEMVVRPRFAKASSVMAGDQLQNAGFKLDKRGA